MFASMPLSSPSHFSSVRAADSAAPAAETISRFDAVLVLAVVVGIAAIVAPSIVVPAVVIVAILGVAWYGLEGLGQALEPIAAGRVEAASAATMINLRYDR